MYVFKRSKRFRKDFKRIHERKDFNEISFIAVIETLQKGQILPARYKNHKLQGAFIDCMECHVQSDILLIYQVNAKKHIVYLLRIGSHSDLF